jgi:hypothetical protein
MLQRILLHLARTHDFPDGSSRHGYDLVAPLDSDGRLNGVEWGGKRARCRVRRFWGGEPDRHGLLVHRPGGAEGATWIIDYDQNRSDDDEAGYRLGTHTFRAGDYVSIRGDSGDMKTFKVADVQPVAAETGGA